MSTAKRDPNDIKSRWKTASKLYRKDKLYFKGNILFKISVLKLHKEKKFTFALYATGNTCPSNGKKSSGCGRLRSKEVLSGKNPRISHYTNMLDKKSRTVASCVECMKWIDSLGRLNGGLRQQKETGGP